MGIENQVDKQNFLLNMQEINMPKKNKGIFARVAGKIIQQDNSKI